MVISSTTVGKFTDPRSRLRSRDMGSISKTRCCRSRKSRLKPDGLPTFRSSTSARPPRILRPTEPKCTGTPSVADKTLPAIEQSHVSKTPSS
eukprot:Skav211449  [mRNA]  locus=scaffold1591:530768:537440:+ [translate_table: standard]